MLVCAWWRPLPLPLPGPFTMHMWAHMLTVTVAAPLLALGVAGSKWDPAGRYPAVFQPMLMSLVELAVVWGWHSPQALGAARAHSWVFTVEQVSFLLCGLGLWLAAFGGRAEGAPERVGGGLMAMLLTSMHMTLLGALIGLAPRELYVCAGPASGESALRDQEFGGAVMLVLGGAVYLIGGLVLLGKMIRFESGLP